MITTLLYPATTELPMVQTYLDFGYIENGLKIPRDSRVDQEAYDFFMIARYLKDLIAYRKGKIENIHHKEDLTDNLRKYCGLLTNKNRGNHDVNPNFLTYYEIGSTIFGVIEALEYLNGIYRELDLLRINFIGVDISVMMNHVASMIHPSYNVETNIIKKLVRADLFFAKGSSLLYAFDNEEELCDILKSCRLCIFDYSFSLLDNPITDLVSTGKPVTFLSQKRCQELLTQNGKKLILTPSSRDLKPRKDRRSLECIYGDQEVVDSYLKELEKKLKDKMV